MVNYVCVLDLGGKSETPFHCGQTPFGCGLRISENLIRMWCLPHCVVAIPHPVVENTTSRWGKTPSDCGLSYFEPLKKKIITLNGVALYLNSL